MARRRRNRSPAARGRFKLEPPKKVFISLDHQSDLPMRMRHKREILVYSNGRTEIRVVKSPKPGIPIRSNMLSIMPLAMFKPSHLTIEEIASQRFKIKNMNDKWRGWDEELWIKKKMEERRHMLHSKRITILSGLPSVSS